MPVNPLFLTLILLASPVISAPAHAALWTRDARAQRPIEVDQAIEQHFLLDKQALQDRLARAGFEGRSQMQSQLMLPMPDGQTQRFRVEQSPILAPALAAKFPDFKTYRVQGLDDPALSGRLSLSSKGFHGMVSGPQGTFYIDPQGKARYRVYQRNAKKAPAFKCGTVGHDIDHPVSRQARRTAMRTPGSLRVYRLAVAATAEYTQAAGGSVSAAMTEIGIAINRVNQIYQRDLGIKLELIAGNDQLIYTDSATDPYTNDTGECPDSNKFCDPGSLMLDENQQNLDAILNPNPGDDNYDLGHVFSTGGGGIAEVGSVCNSSVRAGGVTGLSHPIGEIFYIDYVAHEIGHQFSGEHTFNGTEGSCGGGNRWAPTAFEPGSGSTIMSYAGICGQENISREAIAVFHAGSIELVDDFTTNGNGATCGSPLSINNPSEPQVDGGADYTIPAQTPFQLTAVASDADGDSLTYSWDQMDAGTQTDASSFGQDLGDNSLFRSYLPRSENKRDFPALGTTLLNRYDQSEVLACKDRSIHFRVSVLDGLSGIGQDDVQLAVDAGSGPFRITSHESAQSLSPGAQTINWDVANTDQAPVNCSQVDISLLTFDVAKTSYSETPLLSQTANDGNASVTLPDVLSNTARFKIQCSNNIFYDISDADLSVTGSVAATTNQHKVFYNEEGKFYTLTSSAPACEGSSGSSSGSGGGGGIVSTPKSGGGGGQIGLLELIGLLLLLLVHSLLPVYPTKLRAGSARR